MDDIEQQLNRNALVEKNKKIQRLEEQNLKLRDSFEITNEVEDKYASLPIF